MLVDGRHPGPATTPDTQADTPLYTAVEGYLAAHPTPFTTPGHKRHPGLVDPLLALDLPHAGGADDNQLSHDVLGRAERLAAELWGAGFCRFAVNGSTQGNQAIALALARPGDRVAVSRTVHKSLFAGLLLAGLEPVWMHPVVDVQTGLTAGLPVTEVERALEHDVRAVLVVEPAYTGLISDLPAIADRTHAAGVPLVVDQAWAAHFGLHSALPATALAHGADAMVVSLHKTLAAFTQGALLLANPERLDIQHLGAAFDLLNTTSPSAAILASLDRARHIMATRGEALLTRTLALAAMARAGLAEVPGLRVQDDGVLARSPAAYALDPVKLVLSLAGTGADGFAVERDLAAEGITLEMADRETLVPLITIGDDETTVGRLVAALQRSLAERSGPPRPVSASLAWQARPEAAMTPREAFFARSERVSAARAVGRVSAETAAPYPPGIPALAPGEVVTRELIDGLQAEADAGTRVAYCSDPTLRTLRVVADR
jgi:lysine decarboxylase